MSLARYRLWLPGGPQRKVLFSDFFMTLVRNNNPAPPNVVTFKCHVRMTKFDIKNYLERIYNVPVAKVNTAIIDVPHLRDQKNRRWKPEEDFKYAYVTLGEGLTFEFPNVYEQPEDEKEEYEQTMGEVRELQQKRDKIAADTMGLGTWFGGKSS